MQPLHPLAIALTKIGFGLGATPLLSRCVNPLIQMPTLSIMTAYRGDKYRYHCLSLIERTDNATPVNVIHTVTPRLLAAHGARRVEAFDNLDDDFSLATVHRPDFLSSHDKMTAIDAARAAIIAAGYDPDGS